MYEFKMESQTVLVIICSLSHGSKRVINAPILDHLKLSGSIAKVTENKRLSKEYNYPIHSLREIAHQNSKRPPGKRQIQVSCHLGQRLFSVTVEGGPMRSICNVKILEILIKTEGF